MWLLNYTLGIYYKPTIPRRFIHYINNHLYSPSASVNPLTPPRTIKGHDTSFQSGPPFFSLALSLSFRSWWNIERASYLFKIYFLAVKLVYLPFLTTLCVELKWNKPAFSNHKTTYLILPVVHQIHLALFFSNLSLLFESPFLYYCIHFLADGYWSWTSLTFLSSHWS